MFCTHRDDELDRLRRVNGWWASGARVSANGDGVVNLVSVLVSVGTPCLRNNLKMKQLELEARVGIGHSLELVVPFAQLSQLAPPEARSILDASSTPRFNGFFVCVKHSAARTD